MASGGLLALLDDIAAFTSRFAAASIDDISTAAMKVGASAVDDVAGMAQAGVKGAGAVVFDDIPVSANNVLANQISPERESIVVKKIEKNALLARLIISPITSAVSLLAPASMPIILGAGGAYLAYEGAEKILHAIFNRHAKGEDLEQAPQQELTREQVEDNLVKGAIPTDIIMATEISFIAQNSINSYSSSFNSVADKLMLAPILAEASVPLKFVALLAVNLAVAKGIYGLVRGLVKMDDVGLELAQKSGDGIMARVSRDVGPRMIKAAPIIAKSLGVVGTGAMLWIAGELIVPGVSAVAGHMGLSSLQGGADAITHAVHHLSHAAAASVPESISFMSGFVGWAADAIPSAGIGFAAGTTIVAAHHGLNSCVEAVKKVTNSLFGKPAPQTESGLAVQTVQQAHNPEPQGSDVKNVLDYALTAAPDLPFATAANNDAGIDNGSIVLPAPNIVNVQPQQSNDLK